MNRLRNHNSRISPMILRGDRPENGKDYSQAELDDKSVNPEHVSKLAMYQWVQRHKSMPVKAKFSQFMAALLMGEIKIK